VPRFLENRLKSEAKKKGMTGDRADRYTFGAMNNLGLMAGNRSTAKGMAMEKKHDEDTHGSMPEEMQGTMHGRMKMNSLHGGDDDMDDQDMGQNDMDRDDADRNGKKGFMKKRAQGNNPMGRSKFQSNYVDDSAPKRGGFMASRMNG